MSIRYSLIQIIILLFLTPILYLNSVVVAGNITQVNYFDTYNGGIILSTDPSGITYNGNHLFIVDSEINETGPPPAGYFQGTNVFEITLDGSALFAEYLTTPLTGSREPTGICYSPFDDYYYITNDDTKSLYQYELKDTLTLINYWELGDELYENLGFRIRDPEGVAVNPLTGHLFIADGNDGDQPDNTILIVEVTGSNLALVDSFSVGDHLIDSEGIAFHENSRHLFIMSGPDKKIFEYDLSGNYIDEYDISGFDPIPRSVQGLTFAPSSKGNSRLSLYMVDAGVDENPDRARVFEADLGNQISLKGQLFSFNLQAEEKLVIIKWETISQYPEIVWAIERKNLNEDVFKQIATLNQSDAIGRDNTYEYTDTDVVPGNTYIYRLSDIDSTGRVTNHESQSIYLDRDNFYLAQNRPNPFNPGTTINFDIPEDSFVTIDIFNILGQKVETLINTYLNAGPHSIEFNGKNHSSGVYFYQLNANNFYDVKKMILVK